MSMSWRDEGRRSLSQLKQLTDTIDVQLHENLSEFKDTSLEVAELGVELKHRGRELMEFIDFVLEDIKKADQLHDELKNMVLDVEGRVDNLEQWGKSSLRACEFQPPGQGGIKILAASRLWVSL